MVWGDENFCGKLISIWDWQFKLQNLNRDNILKFYNMSSYAEGWYLVVDSSMKFWVGPNTRIRFEIWFAGGSFLLTAGRKFGGLLAGFNFAWCGSTMKHEIRKNLNSQSVNSFFEIHWLACDSRPKFITLLNTNTNRFAFLLDNFLITISNFENFCLRWLKRHLVVKFTKS